MTFADSYLKACWGKWWTQSVYARCLTFWLVPFIPFAMWLDLLVILSSPYEDID